MAKKNKAQIKFEAETSSLRKDIEQARVSIKTLNAELKLNQIQLKGTKDCTNLLEERIDTLKQKYEEQTKVVEATRQSYEKAVEILGENSKEAIDLKNSLIEQERTQQSIANAINETNKKLIIQKEKFISSGEAISNFGSKAEKLGDTLNKTGNIVSVVGATIGALAISSVKASIDFESAWTGVTKTVDGTEEQLKNLRQGILELSTELPSTANEISAVAEGAGQLGIATESILDFTEVMINLGNSTNVSAEEASSSLAKFANVTKMSASQYKNLGSTIVALGNNFATTEVDIISMAQNLASAGTQVGMSQSDIMALATALSSVGLEAQAGGTAFSKALVEMQLAVETNSKDLKNWADVAGMSTKEFSKLFKEDATSALQVFIEGLSRCEGKTESAIKVLDDMGITETRMRDALLRSANASDTFTNAISLGNKAWQENTALTEEAAKRYETTESKITMLKNEIIKNGIALGDELKPSLVEVLEQAKPLIENITSMVKSFNNLSKTTKNNVINMGTWVVASGPVLKTGGKLITTVGSLVKSYGNAIKSVGEWSAKIKISTAQQTLATTAEKTKTIATTASTTATQINTTATNAQTTATTVATVATNALKVAMIALPIVGVVTGIISLVATMKSMSNETEQTSNKVKEQAEAWKDLKAKQQEQLNSNLSEIQRVQELRQELSGLVEENGKVKEGYKRRVGFILNELNNALGTEYTMTGDVINQYQELSNSIDTLIAKKKANIILESQEETYKTALRDQTESVKKLSESSKELADINKKITDLEKERQNEYDKGAFANLKRYNEILNEIDALKKQKATVEETYSTQKETIQGYYDAIVTYETNAAIVQEGNIDKINEMNNSVIYGYQERKDMTIQSINEEMSTQKSMLDSLKEYYNQNQNEITQKQISESQNRLNTLAQELANQTSTTNIMSPDVIEAWSNLANNSYESYAEIIAKMSPEMQQKIQDITGVIVYGTPNAQEATRQLSESIINELNDSEDARRQAIGTLKGYLAGLTDEEQRELLRVAGVQDVEKVMEGIKEGNLAEDQGKSILESLFNGLNNNTWQGKLFSTASSIASKLGNFFNIKAKVSADNIVDGSHANGLDYVPYDNYIARLHKGERVLTKEENEEYTNGNIENKMGARNITVQFFPQHMTEQEMEIAEEYIRKKWGVRIV